MADGVLLQAPAKINLCLEVLGRRDDGYHEVSTVLQTVELLDDISFELADGISLEVEPSGSAPVEGNLVLRAAHLLVETYRIRQGAHMHLTKRIPAAAGLGGGSSDAAATLLGLTRLWQIEASAADLRRLAAKLGSDVPFFLTGGTAVGTGRGDRVHALLEPVERWTVLLLRGDTNADKTARLYGSLRPEHYTLDASRTAAIVGRLRSKQPITDAVYNAFDFVADSAHPGFRKERELFLEAGAQNPILAGAGPSQVALVATEAAARELADRLQQQGLRAIAVPLRQGQWPETYS